MLNWARRHDDVSWNGSIPLSFLLSAMVSYTPRPLYPRGKSPRHPLDRRLGGPQSRSGRCGEERNQCLYRESKLGRPARRNTYVGCPASCSVDGALRLYKNLGQRVHYLIRGFLSVLLHLRTCESGHKCVTSNNTHSNTETMYAAHVFLQYDWEECEEKFRSFCSL
jgi:hypothetical protein